MNFELFLKNIEVFKNTQLPGIEAQFKLAPKMRLEYNAKKIEANNPKIAAVLALFYPNQNNEVSLLLTKRANYIGTHSGQISFPGGKFEKSEIPVLVFIGVSDFLANLLLGAATNFGLVSLVMVLGSLYPVVTALLAFKFLNERLHRVQYVGIALAVAGVALISAS